MLKSTLISLGLVLTLAGCVGGGSWRTDYTQVDPAVSQGWRVVQVDVRVPQSLTVSEENSYTPEADIVWHGDPRGDRHAQVEAIFREAIRRGTADAKGSRPVTLAVVVSQFHALSPKARGMSGNVGVHDIRFTAQVFDARTGAALTQPHPVEADLAALVGRAAMDADARGYTQKVEITEHLVRVFRHWLSGAGTDPRNSFSRAGR